MIKVVSSRVILNTKNVKSVLVILAKPLLLTCLPRANLGCNESWDWFRLARMQPIGYGYFGRSKTNIWGFLTILCTCVLSFGTGLYAWTWRPLCDRKDAAGCSFWEEFNVFNVWYVFLMCDPGHDGVSGQKRVTVKRWSIMDGFDHHFIAHIHSNVSHQLIPPQGAKKLYWGTLQSVAIGGYNACIQGAHSHSCQVQLYSILRVNAHKQWQGRYSHAYNKQQAYLFYALRSDCSAVCIVLTFMHIVFYAPQWYQNFPHRILPVFVKLHKLAAIRPQLTLGQDKGLKWSTKCSVQNVLKSSTMISAETALKHFSLQDMGDKVQTHSLKIPLHVISTNILRSTK